MQLVTPILRKSIALITSFIFVGAAIAQQDVRLVKGVFTEKVLAEISVNKGTRERSKRIAEFKINPSNQSFVFAIPDDSVMNYSVQIKFMKSGAHHPVLEKMSAIPLSLEANHSYSLAITPSLLNTDKKQGWELKKDDNKSSITLITGKVLNIQLPLSISLQKVEGGALISENSFITNSEGGFAIPYAVKKQAFYYITSSRWRVRVCLQPSDKLELNIDNTTGTITLLNGSAANQILHQWSELIRPITDYGYNLAAIKDSVSIDEYMSTYNKLEPAMDEFVNSFHFAHPDLQSAMKIDKDLAPINLLFQSSAKKIHGFRLTPKDFNEVPDFYQQFIESSKFNSASILTIGEARQYMNLYARLNAALVAQQTKVELPKAEKLRVMMNSIENDTLKSYLFNDQMWEMGANNLSEFNQRFEPHKKYAKRAPAKDSYQSIYNQFGGDTAYIGKSSYNFSLPDTNGKMVSMKDFKGKVILIDVWATWCGPCKGEMPYLKTIEEEYKNNKDIVFVAISLDKAKDKQRWLNYIQKENLPGVHLLDDLGLAFGRKYHVTAIPRYLMIDKKGNWIEVRCPNPSSTEDLKRYIDDALKQKA